MALPWPPLLPPSYILKGLHFFTLFGVTVTVNIVAGLFIVVMHYLMHVFGGWEVQGQGVTPVKAFCLYHSPAEGIT